MASGCRHGQQTRQSGHSMAACLGKGRVEEEEGWHAGKTRRHVLPHSITWPSLLSLNNHQTFIALPHSGEKEEGENKAIGGEKEGGTKEG